MELEARLKSVKLENPKYMNSCLNFQNIEGTSIFFSHPFLPCKSPSLFLEPILQHSEFVIISSANEKLKTVFNMSSLYLSFLSALNSVNYWSYLGEKKERFILSASLWVRSLERLVVPFVGREKKGLKFVFYRIERQTAALCDVYDVADQWNSSFYAGKCVDGNIPKSRRLLSDNSTAK